MNASSNETPQASNGASQVGYGHPPEATRFRKGSSGNPKGRPRGSLNVATVLAKTLHEKVVVSENGRRKTVTKLEAAITQLVNKAATGELRAIRQLVELVCEAEDQQNASRAQNPVIGELDQEVISGVLKRFQQGEEQGQDPEEAANHDDQRH
jgi:Family of unknown function (DUF5681)